MKRVEKKEPESTALREIIESGVWTFLVRILGKPEYSSVFPGTEPRQDGLMNAAEVFRAMGLDLKELSQIFVEEPWKFYRIPAAEREEQPTMGNYLKLGKCRPWDFDGWKQLAVLVEKEIHLVSCDGESEGRVTAAFYPDGEFKRLPEE